MRAAESLRVRAARLRTEIAAITLALRDTRTPLIAKIMAVMTVGYALSPIDLIPDFIPLLGYLDDLILLPCMIVITLRLIPEEVLADCRTRASAGQGAATGIGAIAALLIVLIWAGLIVLVTVKCFI
ncbi:MAG: DUF1232 domain-containing protein [Spirochaetes bacterium]|nr:DUF1232 domain-containing protein [Spirochaetota bacterium]